MSTSLLDVFGFGGFASVHTKNSVLTKILCLHRVVVYKYIQEINAVNTTFVVFSATDIT
jgi:hypothetical protein